MIITTKEGWKLEIKAFSDPHPRIYICTGPKNTEEFTGCVVNRVPYYVSAHMEPDPDLIGEWHHQKEGGSSWPYMSRADRYGGPSDWTFSAREKLTNRLEEIAKEWADEHPEEFVSAAEEYKNDSLERRTTILADLRVRVILVEQEIDRINRGEVLPYKTDGEKV